MGQKPSEYTGYAKICSESTDISDTVILKFSSGATAYFYCGSETNSNNEMIINGTKGVIKLHSRFHHPHKISLSKENGSTETFEFEFQNGFEFQIAEVVDCITLKKLQSSIMPWQDTIDCIEIIENLLTAWGISSIK